MGRNCRHSNNVDCHKLYFSPNAILMNSSRRMIWAGHIAHMEKWYALRTLVGNPGETDNWEYLNIGRKIILKLIIER